MPEYLAAFLALEKGENALNNKIIHQVLWAAKFAILTGARISSVLAIRSSDMSKQLGGVYYVSIKENK